MMLSVDGLAVRYGEAVALFDVSFSVEAGKVLAVLGANGAGKSSLAAAIAGLVKPSSGRVALGGIDITGWAGHRVSQSGVVYLPEGRGIFPGLTVADNLRAMLRWTVPASDRKAALDRALEAFPILRERSRQAAGTLSGGEQQMLSLARTMACRPRLVIADELSLGLAPLMVDVVFEGLAAARAEGVTILLIEQYVERALGFADEALVLRRGRVAWSGPASEASDAAADSYLA